MNAVFAKLQAATLNARVRTGDNRIGTNVSKGLFNVVTVEYIKKPKRFTKVETLSANLTADEAVAYLDGMK